MFRFAIFTTLLVGLFGTATGCIEPCSCHKSDYGLVMVCRELTSLPDFSLARSENAPLIKELYLENSTIATLAPNSFRGLPNLRVLSIKRNKITTFSWNSVNNLANLEQISLIDNPITSIDTTTANLPKLIVFTMNGHGVTQMPTSFFPRTIESIRLDDGLLTSISRLGPTPKLAYFSAKKNKITNLLSSLFRDVATPPKGATLVIDLSDNPVTYIAREFIRPMNEQPSCVPTNPADMKASNSLYWVQLRVGSASTIDKCEINYWAHFLSPQSLYWDYKSENPTAPATGIELRDYLRGQCGGNYICPPGKLPSSSVRPTMTPFAVLAVALIAFLRSWMMQ